MVLVELNKHTDYDSFHGLLVCICQLLVRCLLLAFGLLEFLLPSILCNDT